MCMSLLCCCAMENSKLGSLQFFHYSCSIVEDVLGANACRSLGMMDQNDSFIHRIWRSIEIFFLSLSVSISKNLIGFPVFAIFPYGNGMSLLFQIAQKEYHFLIPYFTWKAIPMSNRRPEERTQPLVPLVEWKWKIPDKRPVRYAWPESFRG